MTIVVDLIDYHARAIQRRHQRFQLEIKGLLATFLDRTDAVSKAAGNLAFEHARQLRVDASSELAPYEGGPLHEAMQEVLNLAEQDAGVSIGSDALGDIGTFNGELLDSANVKIRDALRLDEDSMRGVYRKVVLRAGMMTASGTDPVIALHIAKRGEVGGLQFHRIDRAGRAWSSDIYTRTVARHAMVTAYVENYLMALVSNGVDLAKIPGDAEHEPLIFSIVGATAGYPTLDEIRAKHFHPNTTRLPERV